MLIEKSKSPKLWALFEQFTYSGASRSPAETTVAVSFQAQGTISEDDLAQMERHIAEAQELVGSESMNAFASGDMLLDLPQHTYERWIMAHNLRKVNSLLNEIYENGLFLSSEAFEKYLNGA